MKTKTKMMIKMTIDGQVTLDWPRNMTLSLIPICRIQ